MNWQRQGRGCWQATGPDGAEWHAVRVGAGWTLMCDGAVVGTYGTLRDAQSRAEAGVRALAA